MKYLSKLILAAFIAIPGGAKCVRGNKIYYKGIKREQILRNTKDYNKANNAIENWSIDESHTMKYNRRLWKSSKYKSSKSRESYSKVGNELFWKTKKQKKYKSEKYRKYKSKKYKKQKSKKYEKHKSKKYKYKRHKAYKKQKSKKSKTKKMKKKKWDNNEPIRESKSESKTESESLDINVEESVDEIEEVKSVDEIVLHVPDEKKSFDFEVIYATNKPTNSPKVSPVEDFNTEVTCTDRNDESSSLVTFKYSIDTVDKHVDNIIIQLENDFLNLVAESMCPNRRLENSEKSIHMPSRRRLELTRLKSEPKDEVQSELCSPENAVHECTVVSGEMTAFFTDEGNNSNSQIITTNLLLALKLAMDEDYFINPSIGLFKVTFLGSGAQVEINEIISAIEPEPINNSNSAVVIALGLLLLALLVLLFSIEKRRNRGGEEFYEVTNDGKSIVSDLDTDTDTVSTISVSPSKPLFGRDWLAVPESKQERKFSGARFDTDVCRFIPTQDIHRCTSHLCQACNRNNGEVTFISSKLDRKVYFKENGGVIL